MVLKYKKYMNKTDSLFNGVLSEKIIGIKIDDVLITNFDTIKKVLYGDRIILYFSNSKEIVLETHEIPYKFGEADIEVDLKQTNSFINTEESKGITLEEVKLNYWKAKGFNLFGLTKYLVQIDFKHQNKILSIGFFYEDKNEIQYLTSGQLSVSMGNILQSFKSSSLSYKVITAN